MNIKLPEVPTNEVNPSLDSPENQKFMKSMDDKIARYLIDLNKIDDNFSELLSFAKDDSNFCLKMISTGLVLAYQTAFSNMIQKFIEFNDKGDVSSE